MKIFTVGFFPGQYVPVKKIVELMAEKGLRPLRKEEVPVVDRAKDGGPTVYLGGESPQLSFGDSSTDIRWDQAVSMTWRFPIA